MVILCGQSAREYHDTPPQIRDVEIPIEVALAPPPHGLGMPRRLLFPRRDAREADALVAGRLLTDLKGVSLPVHVYVEEGSRLHGSALTMPHRMPRALSSDRVINLGAGLGVLDRAAAQVLGNPKEDIAGAAIRMTEACGTYARADRMTSRSRLVFDLLLEAGELGADGRGAIREFRGSTGGRLGFLDQLGEMLPWEPVFDRKGAFGELWRRPPLTSREELEVALEGLGGASPDVGSSLERIGTHGCPMTANRQRDPTPRLAMRAARGTKIARDALPMVTEGSASPLETNALLLLCAGTWLGGEAWERPRLNQRIDLTAEAQVIAGRSYCIADALWPEHMAILELDGMAYHADREGFRVATGRTPALESMGYRVCTLTYAQLADLEVLDAVLPALARNLGQTLRPRTIAYLARRERLHRALFSKGTVPPAGL